MDIGTLTVTVAVTALLAVRAAVRVVRRRAAFPALGVAALVLWVALTAVGGWFEVRHHDAQARATTATRLASGDPDARVECRRAGVDWTDLSGTLGMVRYDDPRTARLRASTCAALGSWLWGDKAEPTLDQVVAVHVVSHEAQHVAGVWAEAEAECRAMRWDVAVAEELGATAAEAEALAARYASEVYPHQRDQYLTDCSRVP